MSLSCLEIESILNHRIEILPGKLYFEIFPNNKNPINTNKHAYYCSDNSLLYTAFFADFGPLDLGLTHIFCLELDDKLNKLHENQSLTYYCSAQPLHRRSNSAVLLLAYLIFVKKMSVEEAYSPFFGIEPPFITFRDAAFCINTFALTVLDCARCFKRVESHGHYCHATFNLYDYQHFNKLQHGDCTWIIPGKFIAFSGPVSKRRLLNNVSNTSALASGSPVRNEDSKKNEKCYTLLPEEYIPVLKTLGVTCIIRFNSKCYDRQIFTRAGIRHVDLFYEDGGNPTEAILQSFLSICESERVIAVHCKAGLGRTGTNIAAYMMKHYGYTAREAIAWCRICRPGCVVGPQQQYLMTIEARMHLEGHKYRQQKQNTHSVRR